MTLFASGYPTPQAHPHSTDPTRFLALSGIKRQCYGSRLGVFQTINVGADRHKDRWIRKNWPAQAENALAGSNSCVTWAGDAATVTTSPEVTEQLTKRETPSARAGRLVVRRRDHHQHQFVTTYVVAFAYPQDTRPAGPGQHRPDGYPCPMRASENTVTPFRFQVAPATAPSFTLNPQLVTS